MSESRHHFKIGEVAEMLGVKPHVLRYWEQEFPALRPKKTRGAHRHYSRENVALAREIHELVVARGYSIAGARTQLSSPRQLPLGSADSLDSRTLRDDLLALRSDLVALLDIVDGKQPAADEDADGEPAGAHGATESVPVLAPSHRSRTR